MQNQGRYLENNFIGDYQQKLLDLADGILRTEDGRSFSIHKYQLAKKCKYFYALFCGMEKDKDDFMIAGIKGEDLSNILSFLYTGNIHVTEENISDLIEASDYLLLDDLLLRLKQNLRKNLNPANSLSILKTSLQINQRDISRETYRFTQIHFEDIIRCRNSQISEIPLDILKQLLSDRNLRVTNETVIWWSVIKWVEADIVSRLCLVPELLLHLAILDVDENMADSILQHEIVANNPHCKEIFDVKLRNPKDGLKALQNYFQARTRPVMPLSDHRQPRHLHLIYGSDVTESTVNIYVTYDENVDLWRKITEVDSRPDFVLYSNSCIYLLQMRKNKTLCYSVIHKQWNQLADFRTPRSCYKVVNLGGRMYVLGAVRHPQLRRQNHYDGEYYDFETDDWHTTEPMIPVDDFRAVTCQNFIYVLGSRNSYGEREVIFQAYDPSSDTWNRLTSPSRIGFAMIAYRDTIYVIGGRNTNTLHASTTVEVFVASTNEWITEADIPYEYNEGKAFTLNDKLIVYGESYHESRPPVYWNAQKRWELFEDFSIKSLDKYNFITIENSERLSIFAHENKDPGTQFEYSPFA